VSKISSCANRVLCSKAIDAIARGFCKISNSVVGLPVLPLREKTGNNMITYLELCDAFTDSLNNAGPV
jgi:hypothetical protein